MIKKWILVSILCCVGLMLKSELLFVMSLLLGLLLTNSLSKKSKVDKALKSTLNSVDEFVADNRYIGTNSEVIASELHWDEEFSVPNYFVKHMSDVTFEPSILGTVREVYVIQLCKTNSGAWFRLRFTIPLISNNSSPLSVSPISESEAKNYLEKNKELYLSHFKLPRPA